MGQAGAKGQFVVFSEMVEMAGWAVVVAVARKGLLSKI